ALRDDGLVLLKELPQRDHVAVHWGMCMAVYPFFAAVAEATGRLQRLQGAGVAGHVQRRLPGEVGGRGNVARATRGVLRAGVGWGILTETGEKGVYAAAPPLAVGDRRLPGWLIEAVLAANGAQSRPLRALVESPALYPFSLAPLATGGAGLNGRLE